MQLEVYASSDSERVQFTSPDGAPGEWVSGLPESLEEWR